MAHIPGKTYEITPEAIRALVREIESLQAKVRNQNEQIVIQEEMISLRGQKVNELRQIIKRILTVTSLPYGIDEDAKRVIK